MINFLKKIVLTGAWGGGKTTLINELRADEHLAGRLLIIPEAAPLARQNGVLPSSPDFERQVFLLQHALENPGDLDDEVEQVKLMVCHRGSLDALAFWLWQGGNENEFWQMTGSNYQAEYERYDAVILMRSTAVDLPDVYASYRESNPRPGLDEARRLEAALEKVWSGHPRFFCIPNQGLDWRGKAALAQRIMDACCDWEGVEGVHELNRALRTITYPSTHQYHLTPAGKIIHKRSAKKRLDELNSILPPRKWDTLIDAGCAKGMFLLWAIQNLGIRRAVGLDASPDMVLAARKTIQWLKLPAIVIRGTLGQVSPALAPASLVFVFHVYHYLFFGSPDGAPGIPDHDTWFNLLAGICSDTLVFANPLSLDDEKVLKLKARGIPAEDINKYNRASILASAARHFMVEPTSLGGGRPYLLMRKR